MKTHDVYRFGPFEFDPTVPVLRRNGEIVPLQPKAVNTLRVLFDQRGQYVTNEELRQTLWPDTAVEEGNLTGNITAVRKALGDTSKPYQYITNLPKRGYSFNDATVEPVPRIEPPREVIEIPIARAKVSAVRKTIPGLVAGALVMAAAASFYFWKTGKTIIVAPVEINSPADVADVQKAVHDSQAYESFTLYENPAAAREVDLLRYWLPPDLGGKEISLVKASVGRLLQKGRHYGQESRLERFEFTYTRVFAPGDSASAGTIERWYVPLYENDSRVPDTNVYLGPYNVDYMLRKVKGTWLIAETTTPRKQSPAPGGEKTLMSFSYY